jgi:hypothetical protein
MVTINLAALPTSHPPLNVSEMSFDIMMRVCFFFSFQMSIPIDIRKRFSHQGTKNFVPNVISPESFDGSHFYLTYGLCRVRSQFVEEVTQFFNGNVFYTILLNRLEFLGHSRDKET